MMINRFIQDTRKYFNYSIAAARSLLKAEVAGSYLNWFWWILEPFCFMLIYSFIFGYVFKAREQYFPAFIFTGLSMWTFFTSTVNQSVKSVKNNKAIVSKVYLPKYVLIYIKIWQNGFKMMISLGIVVIMIIYFRIPLTIQVIYAPFLLLILILFTFGCSVFLLHYGVYIEDLANIIAISLKMLIYLTGIFFDVAKRVPAPYGELLSKYNPIAFLLISMRNVLLYGKVPHRRYMVIWFAVSLAISVTGIRKIYKNENSYVKVV